MKKTKRPQTPKPRNEAWARAKMDQANRNLTVPSANVYKRPKAGAKNREW